MTDPIPARLRGRLFTCADARAAGLNAKHLRGRRFRQVLRGLYACTDLAVTWAMLVAGVVRLLPADAAASHLTALRWLGVDLAAEHPLHFSTNTSTRSRLPGVVVHRRQGTLSPRVVHGVPVLGPDRTLVDCATILGIVALVQAAEMMIHLGLTTAERLREYADGVHLDGVVRARRAFALVRDGAESPMETLVRLMLVFARLPEPEPNVELRDGDGRFLGRVDLLFSRWRVVVEYDGAQWHRRTPGQGRRDRERRRLLEEAGWTVVVIRLEDLHAPERVVRDIHHRLVAAGYEGPAPVFSDVWQRWFTPRSGHFAPVAA